MPKQLNNYRDWEFARNALRQVLRIWALEFSAIQLRTALFVYDRTIGWGKQWEVITVEHAAIGVWSEDGECWAAPIAKNRTRARSALQELVDSGHLSKRQKGKSYEYSLNLETMKVPKRLNSTEFARGKMGRNRPFGGVEIDPKRESNSTPKEYFVDIREAKENSSDCAPLVADIEFVKEVEHINTIARSVVVRSRQRQDTRKKQGKFERSANGVDSGFVPFKSSLALVWSDLYRSVYPDEPIAPLPAITLRILFLYAKSWTSLRKEGEFVAYMTWVFENWSMLRAGPFKWMQDFPITPAARIIVSTKLRPLIEEAYQQKEWWSKWTKMDEYERRVQFLTVNKGVDRAKAESIAKRETGFRDEVEAIKQERKKLELAALRVKQAYEQERAASRRQQERSGKPTTPSIQNVEGDFGTWD